VTADNHPEAVDGAQHPQRLDGRLRRQVRHLVLPDILVHTARSVHNQHHRRRVMHLAMLDLQVHRQQFGNRRAEVAAGLVRILAANHYEADAALAHGRPHRLHLLRAKPRGGEVVEHHRVVVEQFFGAVGESALAHARDGDGVRLQGFRDGVARA
jgi:hypothetical protein